MQARSARRRTLERASGRAEWAATAFERVFMVMVSGEDTAKPGLGREGIGSGGCTRAGARAEWGVTA